MCIYIYIPERGRKGWVPRLAPGHGKGVWVGLYKIFVYFEAVHKSTVLSFPPPTCIAQPGVILLHDYWTV